MNKNTKLAFNLCLIVAGMVMLAYASVPLYRIFCQVTGLGGTTQVAEQPSDIVLDRDITIYFDSNIHGDLNWQFEPSQRKVTVKVGENGLAFYKAKNLSNEDLVGMANYNVTPLKAGQYFNKIECFCFIEQTLKAGEEVEMPVSFFIDPAIAEDKNMDEVKSITLSYTFVAQ